MKWFFFLISFFSFSSFFFFQAEDGIRDIGVTGVQTCALPIYSGNVTSLPFRSQNDLITSCWNFPLPLSFRIGLRTFTFPGESKALLLSPTENRLSRHYSRSFLFLVVHYQIWAGLVCTWNMYLVYEATQQLLCGSASSYPFVKASFSEAREMILCLFLW